jgi:hypothetical protein
VTIADAVMLDDAKKHVDTPIKRYYACLATHQGIKDCPVIPPTCIPPRDDDALGGHAVMALPGIKGDKQPRPFAAWQAREQALYEQLVSGNIPWHLRRFTKVSQSLKDKKGVAHEVTYWVMPDYVAVGSSSDYVTVPIGGVMAQRVADAFGCVLPTAKIVWDLLEKYDTRLRFRLRARPYWRLADPKERDRVSAEDKVKYDGKEQASTWAYVEYSDAMQERIRAVLRERELPRWTLITGYRKEVVISKALESDKRKLDFFGGWRGKDQQQKLWQGTPPGLADHGGHEATFADYSHGVRLVRRRVVIDGQDHDIRRVLSDPVLGAMLDLQAPVDLAKARYA